MQALPMIQITTLMLRFCAKKPSFEEKTRFLSVLCTFFLREPVRKQKEKDRFSQLLPDAFAPCVTAIEYHPNANVSHTRLNRLYRKAVPL